MRMYLLKDGESACACVRFEAMREMKSNKMAAKGQCSPFSWTVHRDFLLHATSVDLGDTSCVTSQSLFVCSYWQCEFHAYDYAISCSNSVRDAYALQTVWK